jgi:hypothetical protein
VQNSGLLNKKKEKKIQMDTFYGIINQCSTDLFLSHMEKLLVTHAERLLWWRRESNPVPFSL